MVARIPTRCLQHAIHVSMAHANCFRETMHGGADTHTLSPARHSCVHGSRKLLPRGYARCRGYHTLYRACHSCVYASCGIGAPRACATHGGSKLPQSVNALAATPASR